MGFVKARSYPIYSVMKYVENQMAEKELEQEDYAQKIPGSEGAPLDSEEIGEVSSRLHRMLMEVTTADANAAVRRCRDEDGLLAWKRLCANQNPRTLATALKSINAAHNPGRICEPKKMDSMIESGKSASSSCKQSMERF